jgi:PadR family transcriptional regulator PadR
MMFFAGMSKGEDCGCGSHHGEEFHHGHMHIASMLADRCSCGTDINRRFMRPILMLLLAEEPVHGYELMGRIKDFGIGQSGMDPSLIYRLLRHLERGELAESSLDDSGAGPARKIYRLTPEGMEVLDMWAANLDEASTLLRQFKERYDKLGK